MRALELFAGCGGMAKGMQQAGIEHVALIEKDRSCIETLRLNGFETAHCIDVTCVNYQLFSPVDIVCGGPPCQPFSVAGKHGGQDDERNGWPEAVRGSRLSRSLHPS